MAGSLEALFEDGLDLHQLGRLEEAAARYREVLARAPGHARALHHLGLVAHAGERHDEAAELIARALDQDGTNAAWHADHALVQLALGRPGAAERCLRRALQRAPDHVGALATLGALTLEAGDAEEAAALFARLERATPDDRAVPVQRALAIAGTGRIAQAIDHLTAALPADGSNAPAQLVLGSLLERLGDVEGALAAWSLATALEPEAGAGDLAACALLSREGRSEAARRRAEKLVSLWPAAPAGWLGLGRVRERAGRFEEAALAYARAAVVAPGAAEPTFALACLLRRHGSLDEAIELFAMVVANHRLASDALGNDARDALGNDARDALGEALAAAGRLDEAAALFQDWGRLSPGHPVPRHRAAACAGWNVPDRADDAYVIGVFDRLAADFDRRMAETDDAGLTWVAAALKAGPPGTVIGGATLDLGCGTGRLGQALRGVASRLVGVDLSERMLDQARRRGEYDALVQAEAMSYLAARPNAFDLIASAGLLPFFGPPDGLLAAIAASLRPGGWLILVGEAEAETTPGPVWRLKPDGRYAHRPGALAEALDRLGVGLEAQDTGPLRRDRERVVTGLVLLARRRDLAPVRRLS